MSLKKTSSPKDVGKNIATEKKKHPDMSQKQAVAIALSVQREARKKGK